VDASQLNISMREQRGKQSVLNRRLLMQVREKETRLKKEEEERKLSKVVLR
jgi:hypothetical protein